MNKKLFVYRNSTLEYIFKSIDCEFSSYGGVEKTDDSDRDIVVLYLIPFCYSEEMIRLFVKEYIDKVKYIAGMYPNRKVQVCTLFNYFYRSFDKGGLRINSLIEEANDEVGKNNNVTLIDIDEFFIANDGEKIIDEKYYYLYNAIINPRLATLFLNWFENKQRQISGIRKKCLVLDLDNTLWSGILGERGAAGIMLSGDYPGNAYHDFQLLIKEVAKTGIILCTCSRNDEDNVRNCFEMRDDMVLKYDDFVLHSINWEDKPQRIAGMAKKLNIGLDSMVFVDDNPREREAVRTQLPEVYVPDFPSEPYQLVSHFVKVFDECFGGFCFTDEDKNKKTQYEIMLKSEELKKNFDNEEEFITNLGIELTIVEMNQTNISRISQLINKSNQFNMTTRRYSEEELRLMQKDGCLIYGIKVKDRFGDLGLSGVIIVKMEGDRAIIDTFLMSCRVLGRRIEDEFLKVVLNKLHQRGVLNVIGEYVATKKNGLVSDYYKRSGFEKIGEGRFEVNLKNDYQLKENYKIEEEK